jgi:hypothetical protein
VSDDAGAREAPSLKSVRYVTLGCLLPQLFFSAWTVLLMGFTTKEDFPNIFAITSVATFLALFIINLVRRSRVWMTISAIAVVMFWTTFILGLTVFHW